MVRKRRGFTGLRRPFAETNGDAPTSDHDTGEAGPAGRTAVKLKVRIGLAALLAMSFGCGAGAQARQGNWDETAAWREIAKRDRYFSFSDPAIPSITGSFHFKSENFDWNTYQDLRTKGQIPRYMMRPPIGIFDQKGTP